MANRQMAQEVMRQGTALQNLDAKVSGLQHLESLVLSLESRAANLENYDKKIHEYIRTDAQRGTSMQESIADMKNQLAQLRTVLGRQQGAIDIMHRQIEEVHAEPPHVYPHERPANVPPPGKTVPNMPTPTVPGWHSGVQVASSQLVPYVPTGGRTVQYVFSANKASR